MNLRRAIERSLWAGAVLLLAFIVAAVLWGLFHAVGDPAGAEGARGVALTVLVGWVLNFVILVVLLALAQISAGDRGHDRSIDQQTDSTSTDAD